MCPACRFSTARDLVNWTLVNHALPTLGVAPEFPPGTSMCRATAAASGRPRSATTRANSGSYYPDPDFGIYVVTATDPRGTWSAPQCVKVGRGLIDPCPLWDDDGRVYLVHAGPRAARAKRTCSSSTNSRPMGPASSTATAW